MPLVTAIPKGLQNGNVLTEFTDTTNTSSVTYTYPTQQTSLIIENSGEKDIFVAVGSYTNQVVKADKKWRVDVPFTSFSIRSDVDSQEFIATSVYKEVQDFSAVNIQFTDINQRIAEVSAQIGSGGGSVQSFETLSALNSALPSGSNSPVWVSSEKKWYYWDGVVIAPDTTPPNNVTGVNASNVTQTSMTIGWTAITDATSYEVWKNGSLATTVSTTSHNATGLTADTAYSWVIKSKDAAGNTASGSTPLVQSTLAVDAPDTTPPVLTITPANTFSTTQQVTMSTEVGATIYYTLDGVTEPTIASDIYSIPLNLSATTTVKAFAKDTAGNESAVQTVTFTKQELTDGITEDFTGTDGTEIIGTTTQQGNSWSGRGIWTINNNQALYGSTATAGELVAQSNISNGILTTTVVNFGSPATRLVVRYVDSGNHMLVDLTGGGSGAIRLYKVVSGGYSNIKEVLSVPLVNNDIIKVSFNNDVYEVYVNDVLKLSHTVSVPSLVNATKHGLGGFSINAKFDNLSVVSI